jgi:hypothetical protein
MKHKMKATYRVCLEWKGRILAWAEHEGSDEQHSVSCSVHRYDGTGNGITHFCKLSD